MRVDRYDVMSRVGDVKRPLGAVRDARPLNGHRSLAVIITAQRVWPTGDQTS